MELIIDVFRNRPSKTIGTFIVALMSIVTIVMFQELKVESLSALFDYILNNQDNSTLLLTWGFNLFTFLFLVVLGMLWIKDVLRDNCMDIEPLFGRLISLVIGVLHLGYSILFLNYIFSDILGVALAAIIILGFMYSETPKKKR